MRKAFCMAVLSTLVAALPYQLVAAQETDTFVLEVEGMV